MTFLRGGGGGLEDLFRFKPCKNYFPPEKQDKNNFQSKSMHDIELIASKSRRLISFATGLRRLLLEAMELIVHHYSDWV